jgi:uncharacterized protein (DUF58 family)
MFWAERLGLAAIARRMRQWSLSRFPRSRSVTLTQNRIYILPTGSGFGFLVLLLLLLLMAINYENNLTYAFTFLLASLFVISILHTYGNLAGLKLNVQSGQNCFKGEYAGFTLQLHAAPGRDHEQLSLKWETGPELTLDLTDQRMTQVELSCPAPARGWLDPGPLRLQTRFPLGLFRAWTWIDTGLTALVYPYPQPCRLPGGGAGDSDDREGLAYIQGTDEYQGLSRYQPGVSPGQIAWKNYARGQGLYVKDYASLISSELWLDWENWPGGGVEARLSGICYWVLEFSTRQQPFGLRLPGFTLPPGTGETHKLRALQALALFGKETV